MVSDIDNEDSRLAVTSEKRTKSPKLEEIEQTAEANQMRQTVSQRIGMGQQEPGAAEGQDVLGVSL